MRHTKFLIVILHAKKIPAAAGIFYRLTTYWAGAGTGVAVGSPLPSLTASTSFFE
jgi:hypothetical protein